MTPDLVFISGASRGFGQAAAIALTSAFPRAIFHLHASSTKSLESTLGLLAGSTPKLHGIDLAKLASGDSFALVAAKSLQESIEADVALAKAAGEQGKILFVHSAAILGPTGPLEGILGGKPDAEAFALFAQAAQVNVAGSLALTSLVSKCTSNPSEDLACINVSTKCAVFPGAFALFDVYSITKSAAHFMFASLASRGIKVLQYCPGPMRTDMTSEQHTLEWPWVEPLDSARAMVATFVEGKYESGAVIDYLDDGLAAKYSGKEKAGEVEEGGRAGLSAPAVPTPALTRPYRCVITRIETFCASHTLENCSWCEDKNKSVFGKCNNLHGHNYKVEFSFAGTIDQETGMVVNISDVKVILQDFLGRFDHSHLNDHQDIFKGAPTTAEVISQVLFEQVGLKVKASKLPTYLLKVKVWETDKNIAEFGEI